MEIWKFAKDYDGLYEVSNCGRIRSYKYSKIPRVLKQKIGKDNCCRVSLWKDKKEKTWLVHRLVALAFLEKPEGKDYVNHIDGNRLNNNLSNLEWCDHTENNNHAFDNRLIKTGKQILLLDKETKEIRIFRSMAKAGMFLGRNHGFISRILKDGKTEYNGFQIIQD